MKDLPYSRLAVVAHGGVFKRMISVEMGHGQYVMGEMGKDGIIVLTQFSAGAGPYLED